MILLWWTKTLGFTIKILGDQTLPVMISITVQYSKSKFSNWSTLEEYLKLCNYIILLKFPCSMCSHMSTCIINFWSLKFNIHNFYVFLPEISWQKLRFSTDPFESEVLQSLCSIFPWYSFNKEYNKRLCQKLHICFITAWCGEHNRKNSSPKLVGFLIT